jgi:hypothetical protein
MRFVEYSCYYLYNYYLNKGKYHDAAKTAAVGYVMVSVFFFFISPFLFLRTVNVDINDKYECLIKGSFVFVATLFYIYLYYRIERESKFVAIVERYNNMNPLPYPKVAVWSFILGGIFCFCLSFVIIEIISNS